jgi:hypothetical protein
MTKKSNSADYKHWHVVRSVELGAPAATVWDIIGGFFTIHEWHPDISKTEISAEQTQTNQLRRILTFPGQPTTTEELVSLTNDDFHYRYKWHQGQWGEQVQNYESSLRVLSGDLDKTCVVRSTTRAMRLATFTGTVSTPYKNVSRSPATRSKLGYYRTLRFKGLSAMKLKGR